MSIANILGTHPPQQNCELLATKKKLQLEALQGTRGPDNSPLQTSAPSESVPPGEYDEMSHIWRDRNAKKCHDWTPSARNGVTSPWFFGCAVSGAWVEIPEPRAQNGGCFSWKPCLEPEYWDDNHARRAMGKCASCRAISVTGKSLSCEATVG